MYFYEKFTDISIPCGKFTALKNTTLYVKLNFAANVANSETTIAAIYQS